MRSKKARKDSEGRDLFLPSVSAVAHRFHFHSLFWCLLSSQVETQHLIGQLTNDSGAKGQRL